MPTSKNHSKSSRPRHPASQPAKRNLPENDNNRSVDRDQQDEKSNERHSPLKKTSHQTR